MNLEVLKNLSVNEKFNLLWELSKNYKRYPKEKIKILKRELLKDKEVYYLARIEGLI